MFGKGREPGWKEVYLVVTNTDDTENLRLGTFIKEKIGWDKNSKDKLRAIIEIAPNVIVYSDVPSIPALSINAEDFRSYDQLFLIVKENASIYGAAGASGPGGGEVNILTSEILVHGSDGGNGGTAVFADRPVRLINHGKIYGGGGGGGGGGGHQTTSSSGGSSTTRCEGKKGGAGGYHCCPVMEPFTKEVCRNR